ncbi:ADP-glucose pyrophosphorylase family protein isoform 3 [Hibiscus syriacus]|uniref:ADP-glucose pyrophosphorylase family protein isoform 3 n=1 Tax=Hibiscus syriacus TaxID=106335 RepID=A0A6A2WZE1_HIBSY|nr:ADP-glucose pyrophosphorylase family protein isoform 3 [Hibiscus syriacus]
MGISEGEVVAVIMVGGPTKGTRFRSLSFNIPKPLLPLAGQPMVHHPISACKRIPNLAQIFLIGFYEEREFTLYVSSISNELKIPVRYLKEDKPHGSAGALYYFLYFFMLIFALSRIFLLNCDVCCSFPLTDMLEAHKRYGGMGTLLVSAETANQFGKLVADRSRKSYCTTLRNPRLLLDQDILSPFAGKQQLYTYETMDFWEQIKTPGMSLKCSGLYLAQLRLPHPIGPNVCISANGRIGAGARLISCIVLDDVEAHGDYNVKLGITILGEAVIVEDEVVVINSIVLPNKTLNLSVQDEIIL